MKKILKKWIKLESTIILELSLLELEALKSYRHYISSYKKLYIIQSFSKFYSCAGVRIGAVFAHQKSIKKLNQEPWRLSSLDVSFLKERLEDRAFKDKTLQLHRIQKAKLQILLEKSNLFDLILKSDTNFILAHSQKAKVIFWYLLEHKILLRSCESFEFLDDGWLRFAVKDKRSHKILAEALTRFDL